MASIEAVIVDPDGSVRLMEIDRELSVFQSIVGGYIEAVMFDDFTIYVNEEGVYQRLRPNRRVQEVMAHPRTLLGTALITGSVDEDGYDTDVPEHIIHHYELEH